jgi:hypothetical protein
MSIGHNKHVHKNQSNKNHKLNTLCPINNTTQLSLSFRFCGNKTFKHEFVLVLKKTANQNSVLNKYFVLIIGNFGVQALESFT